MTLANERAFQASIVFLNHDGYDFAFINLAEHAEPDGAGVYWCNECGDKRRAANSFTEFLLNDVEAIESG